MRRENWEQDLRERQRNLVFPDTVRNEGNFYRGIFGKTPLRPIHRFGLLLLAAPMIVGGSVWLAESIADVLRGQPSEGSNWITVAMSLVFAVFFCVLGSALIIRALRAGSPHQRRKKSRDHQHSSKF